MARLRHKLVRLDPARVGRDARRIADELIARLSGPAGTNVRVTLEIETDIPSGVLDNVVRTVMKDSCTLKFTGQGSEND